MAITFVTKDGNMQFLEKLGVGLNLRDALDQSGLQVHLGFSDFEIRTPSGTSLQKIKLATSSNSIMKGTAPGPVVKAVCGSVTVAINKALHTYHGGPTTIHAPVEDFPEAVIELPVIPLTDAEYLYQPVRGTSSGSKYFLVARAGHIKVAARVQGSTVSIRVVGTSPEAKNKFLSVGLDEKGDHLSAHFEANSQATPHKIIGAVLMGTGIPFDTTLPSVDLIVDKGA